ncbi:MAG: isochorismate synthase, partial [Gammaproteobacteria bacterium]|nr:isochorismate synthase [Gammaproteobacteria bacterium]
ALQQAIDTIRQGGIEKVVWGTAQPFQLSQPLPLLPALRGLEQRNRRGVQLFFSERGKKWFAAPPEQLLRKEEQQIETEALAGTLPRGNSSEQEQQLEEHLLNDPKLQHEHQLVSDFIQQQLQHHCTTLEASAPPTIHKLENIQHLLTPIRGQLSPGSNLFELIEALHQSPAICGTPKPTSLKWLQQHHNSHRGYYCGGAGWITPQGDGEIYVLLRCAMVEEDCATLYAGAGIVNGSSAEEEQREIALKIQGMVNTLTDTTA